MSAPSHHPVSGTRQRRVLIVDDSYDARDMYSTHFRALGYEAFTASDGDTGIDVAISRQPDVIVLDLAMPRVDGATAAQRLKRDARTRDIPVILLTGHLFRAIDSGVLEKGIDVFLMKPCLPEDLEAHVKRLFRSKD